MGDKIFEDTKLKLEIRWLQKASPQFLSRRIEVNFLSWMQIRVTENHQFETFYEVQKSNSDLEYI